MTRLLSFINYTRVQFCVLSMSLTAASSMVLISQIDWQPITIVGLSTFVVYSFDNLFDYPQERKKITKAFPFWKTYFWFTVFAIPFALLTIGVLAFLNSFQFFTMLIVLGLISISHTILTQRLIAKNPTLLIFGLENLVDSFVWALVAVLIPVVYAGHAIVPQVYMAIGYVWLLGLSSAFLWDLSDSSVSIEKGYKKNPFSRVNTKLIKKLFLILSFSALVLSIVDIILGFFPWYNLIVTSAPIISLLFWSRWETYAEYPSLYANIFYVACTICSVLVILVYFWKN